MRILRRATAGIAISVLAAAGLVAAGTETASAVTSCTLKGSLPSKVVINKSSVSFYSKLSGSGNCNPSGGEFDEADAYLDGPNGIEDYPIWDHVGQQYRFDFYAFEGHPGTYTLDDGEALIWTSNYDEVPVYWTNTKTSIRYGSKLSIATKRSGKKVTVSGSAKKYTTSDEYKAYKTTLYLQRKTKTAKSYKTYKTLKSSSSGKISYSYTSGKAYDYRLVITDASGVWGTTSTTSYR